MVALPNYCIDVVSVFRDRLWLRGWLFDQRPVKSLYLRTPGLDSGQCVISSWGTTDSADVENAHGDIGRNARFDQTFVINQNEFDISVAVIIVEYEDGGVRTIPDLALSRDQVANNLLTKFRSMICDDHGELLEVGSRARSGVTRRDITPQGWGYVGLDIMHGPNVDLAGDAHELTRIFPTQRFDAVIAFSVLEHLLMPWKFVIELNGVLNKGAVGLFTTHQCWPIHDQPWDFWRFSDQAWHGLLNRDTGFEILDATMAEPAFIVAQRCHPVTNFGIGQTGFLASNVLFRKTADTSLTWPTNLIRPLLADYPV
jgi:hypothetical protein